MLSIEEAAEACRALAADANELARESIALGSLNQRILAENLFAQVQVPPFDNSAMDGYALNSQGKNRKLEISQRIAAGDSAQPLAAGTAARIFTGAMIPEGADAVVMQENCSAEGESVSILQWPPSGENIRRAGEDLKIGDPLLSTGERINAAKIASLASCGISEAKVFKRARVTIFSTGDELRQPGQSLEPGQIFDSNRPMLQAFLQTLNVELVCSEHLPDDQALTEQALKSAAEASDIIITAGGVSVGEEDHVKAALEKVGRMELWKVCMKPGKPLSLGKIDDTCFIGLPGNPVSAFVSMFIFGQVIVRTLAGEKNWQHRIMSLTAGFSCDKKRKRPEFIRVQIGNGQVVPYSNQGSGVISSLVWADALALIPADTAIQQGQILEVYPL